MPHSDGIISKIPKRPESERTQHNKNIAIVYALLRISHNISPLHVPIFRSIFQSLGLDLNDNSLDLSTPIGIGNFAALNVFEVRKNDGMNQLGNLNRKKYNRIPFEDYTNFISNNTAYELRLPGIWQPNFEYTSDGLITVQQHTFPQLRFVVPYFTKNIKQILASAPLKSDPLNFVEYRNQADEVLKESAQLDDYKKMASEHFDNILDTYLIVDQYMSQNKSLQQDDLIILNLMVNLIRFDATIVTWNNKLMYNSVRPVTAIKFLYKNIALTAWGGPGIGTVTDITGKEWKSYLHTDAHSEFPSLNACLCSAVFTFYKKYFRTNDFGLSITKIKGSSIVEPDLTPSQNITLGPYKTFDDYIDECAISRVWGGVNFMAAIKESKKLCAPIGLAAYDFVLKHIKRSAEMD